MGECEPATDDEDGRIVGRDEHGGTTGVQPADPLGEAVCQAILASGAEQVGRVGGVEIDIGLHA